MGCKYTGLVSAVIPFGLLALLETCGEGLGALVGCYVLGWAVVMSPWLLKNVLDTRNPVYPLECRVFPSPEWDQAREVKWQEAHGPREIDFQELKSSAADWWHRRTLHKDAFQAVRPPGTTHVHHGSPRTLQKVAFKAVRQFWSCSVDVAGRSDWQSPLYVALAPLALLRRGSRRLALVLWLFAAYIFLTWWFMTHRLDRFWLPILPPLAILAGLGADWPRSRSWSILLGIVLGIGVFVNFVYISTALAGLNEWTADLVFLRRDIPRRWNTALARLDEELPPDARPLLVGQAAVFHMNHQVAYNTVFNLETIELLAKGKSTDEFHRTLAERRLTHVYVDWKEIARHRGPGGYGFTDFVVPERFAGWVASGVLSPPRKIGPEQELYEVRPVGKVRPGAR